jgi:hypothetical protein
MNMRSVFTLTLAVVATAASAQRIDSAATRSIVIEPDGGHHGRLRADIWTDSDDYIIGDSIDVGFRVSDDAYVYIFNTDTLGRRTQIFPNYYDQDNFVRGGREYRVPSHGYDLRVSGPAGRENLEIYAVGDNRRYVEIFHDFDRGQPFRPLTSRGESALQGFSAEGSVTVERRNGGPVRANSVIVVEEDTRHSNASAVTTFDVHDRRVRRYYGADLTVNIRPRDAAIYIDGAFVTRGPATIENLEPGYHQVEIHQQGYRTYRERICIEPGRDVVINVSLERSVRRYRSDAGGPVSWFETSIGGGGHGDQWSVNLGWEILSRLGN